MGMNKWKFNRPFETSILVDNVHSEQALAVVPFQLNSPQICDGKQFSNFNFHQYVSLFNDLEFAA